LMTEVILLSDGGFDSIRLTKRAWLIERPLFRISDEAVILIRLFVMIFSIADISHRDKETGEKVNKLSCLPFFLLVFLSVSAMSLWPWRRQSMNGRPLSLRFIDA
jgi:hypothetical protein